MRNLTKLVIVLLFLSAAVAVFLNGSEQSRTSAQAAGRPTPTPAAAANANKGPVANSVVNAATPAAAGGDRKIPKSITLGKDSQSEHGEVSFDHDSHAFKMYSPDGKSPIACIECHHTDQPKSGLKPPLVTSDSDVVLTLASWSGSTHKVKDCRSCHFQSDHIADGATMPAATYTERGKQVTKELNNELAYHINCNSCHDAAAKLRPELKSRSGFATTTDCMTCHRPN